MSDLLTPADVLNTFYRLLNVTEDDEALDEHGEATNAVAFQYLTRGVRRAQRTMLSFSYGGWRKLSGAISWTIESTGHRKADLPSDFLRAFGSKSRSPLITPDGRHWGRQIDPRDDEQIGNLIFFRDPEIWLTRRANPPSPLFLDYHYRHEAWSDSVTIDFPLEARGLIPAEAASLAMEEAWFPMDRDGKLAVTAALLKAKEEARDIARPSKQARRMRAPRRYANRWAWAGLLAGALSGSNAASAATVAGSATSSSAQVVIYER